MLNLKAFLGEMSTNAQRSASYWPCFVNLYKHFKVHLLTWHSVCDSVYPVLPGAVGCHHGVGERHELVGRAEAQAGVVSTHFKGHQRLQTAPARAFSRLV